MFLQNSIYPAWFSYICKETLKKQNKTQQNWYIMALTIVLNLHTSMNEKDVWFLKCSYV